MKFLIFACVVYYISVVIAPILISKIQKRKNITKYQIKEKGGTGFEKIYYNSSFYYTCASCI